MKKIVVFLCLIFLCSLLSACDPGTFRVDVDLVDQVVSVELIEYHNPQQRRFRSWVPNHFNQLRDFDFDKMTVLETLPEEKIADFWHDFSGADILDDYCWHDSPNNTCIRVNYANGDFLIIWSNYPMRRFDGYIGEYAADGSVLSFWGSFSALSSYTDLVSRYFSHPLS